MSPKLLTPERRQFMADMADMAEDGAAKAEREGNPAAAAERMSIAHALRCEPIVMAIVEAHEMWLKGQAKTPAPVVEEERDTARVQTLDRQCRKCGHVEGGE